MRQGNRVVWVVLLGFSAITFIMGVSLGKGRMVLFEVNGPLAVSEETSIYDLTKGEPVQVILEMNDTESLELDAEGQEAVLAFWDEHIHALSTRLTMTASEELSGMRHYISSVKMLFISWSYPNHYQLIVEADGQTFSSKVELELPQPPESSKRFEIQRISFAIVFWDERILSAFEHSLASPSWYANPELRREIIVEKQAVQSPGGGVITATFADIDGTTTTIETMMPLPPTRRGGARLERAISLLRWYSYVMLTGYIYSLLETGRVEPALSRHERLARAILRIKTRPYDWAGDFIVNDYVEVTFIPPPQLPLIYFFCF